MKSINDVGSLGGNFAADYNYSDNGTISKAQFFNPDIDLGISHNRYHWNFGYDNLDRLTGADYDYGSSWSSSYFDVTGLAYYDTGNLTSQSGKIDDITYNYRNLPVHFDLSNGSDLYAAYYADGQRILKEPGITTGRRPGGTM